MIAVILRLTRPYYVRPWRSPLLRWRMETYGLCDAQGRLLHADEITPARFARFLLQHASALWRFCRWAASL